MFERSDTKLLGCFLLTPRVFRDTRGTFVKTFMSTAFNEMGLTTEWAEDFWSVSSRGVLRGMHFQLPPHAHAKTVTCLEGQIFDAVLDLRAGSPTFGMHQTFYLDANAPVILFIPRGLAHGFQALSESALVLYKTETVQAPNAEAGILWSSCGIAWPLPPSSAFQVALGH